MGSIPLPALNIRPPQQQPSPVEQYGNLMQLKSALQEAPLRRQILQQQAQEGQVGLQQAQQAQQDQQAFRDYWANPENHGKTMGAAAEDLAKSGKASPALYQQLKKADLEARQGLATLTKDDLDNLKKGHEATQQLYSSAMSMPDDQLAANWPAIAQQYDQIPGNQKQPLDPSKPLTKQQLSEFGPMLSMKSAYIDETLERQKRQADLQHSRAETKNLEGKTDPTSSLYAPSAEAVAMGTAPGADQIKAGQVKLAGQKSAAEAAARQPFEFALNKQRQALSQGDPKAAADLLISGDATLGELKSRGATPDFIARTLFEARKQSNGAYNAQAAEANFNVAKSPANVAFFGSAKSLTDKGGTLDQLAEVAKHVPSSNVSGLNSIADWTKAATGDGPLAHYAATALGVADDYAKVMGGGQGSDTSRLQALNLIKANAGPDARAGALAGIRGAVTSQVSSRIGNNPVLKRMYGDVASAPTPATAPIEGSVKTNSHGDKIMFKGGQWVLQQ